MTDTVVYHTDTSDMLIPHGLFRSVLNAGTVTPIVHGVRPGDTAHVADVHSYFDNVLRFLDAHHGGEDAVVWPVLTTRCATAADLIARMESEHEAIHELRERAGALLQQWSDSADPTAGRRFAEALAALRDQLDAHFLEEEQEILPLASAHMSAEEWGALPGHAMAHFSGDKIWLILGLIFEQMTEEQLAETMQLLPPPVVEMWTTSGEAAFDEFVARVRRTT